LLLLLLLLLLLFPPLVAEGLLQEGGMTDRLVGSTLLLTNYLFVCLFVQEDWLGMLWQKIGKDDVVASVCAFAGATSSASAAGTQEVEPLEQADGGKKDLQLRDNFGHEQKQCD